MTDSPAKAVDKTKESADPAHKEAEKTATEKLKADATPGGTIADTKPADKANTEGKTEKKKEGTEKKEGIEKSATQPEETFAERAWNEIRNSSVAAFFNHKPVDATLLPPKVEPKAKEPLHLDVPPLNFGTSAKLSLDTAVFKPNEQFSLSTSVFKPSEQFTAKPFSLEVKPETSFLDSIWGKVSYGFESATKYVSDTWNDVTSNIAKLETSIDKFGINTTTKVGSESDYKLAYDKFNYFSFEGTTSDQTTTIKDGTKKIVDKGTGNSYMFDDKGNMAIDSKEIRVVVDKTTGVRHTTDIKSGDIIEYDPKTFEATKTEKNGRITHYSKEEVETQYGDFVTGVNVLVARGNDVTRGRQAGEFVTHGDNVTVVRDNDSVSLNSKERTLAIVPNGENGKPSGVTHKLDFKTGTVITDNNGVKSEPMSMREFFQAHPQYRNDIRQINGGVEFDQSACDKSGRRHNNRYLMNGNPNATSDVVITDTRNGQTLKVDAQGDGKFKQVQQDVAGKQIGNATIVNPQDKEHAFTEVNEKGVVIATMDTSGKEMAIKFNDSQGNNLMAANAEGDVVYGYGDSAFGITHDNEVYGSHGELLHTGSSSFSAATEASAKKASAEASAACAAASNAASIVASAMSNPGSMDAGYLSSILGAAYNAASAAFGHSLTSFSTSGMVAANSAMGICAAKFNEVGRVSAERANLQSSGLTSGFAINDALKLSMSGGYTPQQAKEWAAKQQDNSAA